MENTFFSETIIEFKNSLIEYEKILSEIKNPIKRFLFKRKGNKINKNYLSKLKIVIYERQLDLEFLHEFIIHSSLNRDIDYKEKRDVFNQVEEIKAIYNDKNNNPKLVIFLYTKRKEIRFAKYIENTDKMIQYPRHVFINSVSKENAVYEYDEDMIRYIRNFIWETCLDYLGDDLKCLH